MKLLNVGILALVCVGVNSWLAAGVAREMVFFDEKNDLRIYAYHPDYDSSQLSALEDKYSNLFELPDDMPRFIELINMEFYHRNTSALPIVKTVVMYRGDTFVGFVNYALFEEVVYGKSSIVGKICRIIIEPEFQGRRYGKQLMQLALDDLKKGNVDSVTFGCDRDNARALALCESIGFKKVDSWESMMLLEYRY